MQAAAVGLEHRTECKPVVRGHAIGERHYRRQQYVRRPLLLQERKKLRRRLA
jgi:hypothetical protein